MSETLEQQLVRHEGLSLKPYHCPAGKLTIGVGRNLDNTGITYSEAMHLLRNDITRVYGELSKSLPWVRTLDQYRRDVLANMVFNLGMSGLLKFKNMLSALEKGDYDFAARCMLDSTWAKQVGNRAVELSNIMRKGG